MTRTYAFEMEDGVCRTFTNVSVLKRWLESKRWECNSPEEFSEWLQDYFDGGNEISVHGEHYDFWSCVELI